MHRVFCITWGYKERAIDPSSHKSVLHVLLCAIKSHGSESCNQEK